MFGKLNEMLDKADKSGAASKVFNQVNEKAGGNLDHLKNEAHVSTAKDNLKKMGDKDLSQSLDLLHKIAKDDHSVNTEKGNA